MILTQSNFSDMPKIHSPLVREETDDGYFVTDEINTDDEGNSYEWVFEDPRTMAVEKLHGTNVSVKVQDGQVSAVWNRENRIPLIPQHKNQRRIISGVQNSVVRGYVDRLEDGQVFGELIGPKINGNHYDLEDHIWIPFASYGQRHLQYKSFGKYDTDPEDIRGWFSEGLIPLFYSRWHDMSFQEAEGAFVEGIMFTHPEPQEIDTLPYAKLRRDMYPFYEGAQIH